MIHPCKQCQSKYIQGTGRIYCPYLNQEIDLEDCNRMYGKTPKQAIKYFEENKK
jgi:hypothetical protein